MPIDAPPLFAVAAQDDAIAADDVLELYTAWTRAGRPAELHLYTRGGHGFGMKRQDLPIDSWIDRFYEWLHGEGFR